MTKKQRSLLFFSTLFLFVIAGPSIVLYSQGYRIDFQNKKLVQTGAFYFSITPKSVRIEINSLSEKKARTVTTDFLFGTAYVENLLPGKYRVKIIKQGYHDWEKTLEINEKMATEIKNATLIPENPFFEILAGNIEDYFYFPEKNVLIIIETSDQGEQILSRYNPRTNSFSIFFTLEQDESLIDLKELVELNRILIETEKKEIINYYLVNIEKNNDYTVVHLPDGINKISLYPKEEKTLIFLKDKNVFLHNYEKKQTLPLLSDVVDYSFDRNNNLSWLSADGFLTENIENSIKINKFPLEIKNAENYQIILSNSFEKIVKIDKIFYFLNDKESKFEQIFESPYAPVISPDSKKIAYFNDYEIMILFLEKIDDQPQKNRMDSVFLTRFSKEIRNIGWYTSHYLLFNLSNQIKIIEIDNRDNVNIVDLIAFENPKMHFNLFDKKLYVLSEKNLFVSQKLLP